MTDRVNMLFVVLEENVRTDDIEPLVNAIRQMRGVMAVELNVAQPDHYMAYQRARIDLEQRIWKALRNRSEDEKDR